MDKENDTCKECIHWGGDACAIMYGRREDIGKCSYFGKTETYSTAGSATNTPNYECDKCHGTGRLQGYKHD